MSTVIAAPARARSRMRTWVRIAIAAAAFVLILVFALAAFVYLEARSALPQVDGTISVAGLSAPVEVLRDAQGVPHIRARNLGDLLFAQGYVTAQDRLWEMDVSRRFAAGEMAEILGPDWIRHDRQQRILSIREAAEKSAAQLDSQSRELFGHYAAGINAFILQHRKRLPLEFRLLGYEPRPWALEDSFLIGANMAQFLNHDEFEQKLKRERITNAIGSELAADLFPNVTAQDLPPEVEARQISVPKESDQRDENDKTPRMNLTFLSSPQVADEVSPLRAGSNNWVVSGAHTVSGKPLLSNDMHLRHQIPNVWYEAQLTAGDFDVAGVTLPGLPFVIVGHNRRIAWGFTNLGPDVEDIYVEKFNSQGKYLTPSGWQEPQHRREIIHVKGRRDFSFDVLSTRHGPMVNQLVPGGEQRQLSLKWTLYELGLSAPFREIDSAKNWNEFRAAFKQFLSPAQNVVYADVDGNIGYQATGAIPLRFTGNGAAPVEGSSRLHDWTGYIPFEQLPSIYNPPSGILGTANGRIAADDYPHVLSNEWESPMRTRRIFSVLSSGRKFVAADMLALQNDIYSAFDLECAENFARAAAGASNASPRARQAAELLRSWDGRLTKESAAATIELLARENLLKLLLQPKIGGMWRDYIWYNSATFLQNILRTQPARWLPAGYQNFDQLLLAAVEETVNDPAAPRKLEKWSRGAAFPLELQHPIFGQVPFVQYWAGPGRVEQSGGGLTVKQVGRSFGPSERMTVDFSDLDSSTLNIVTGQSGEIFSPHFMDQWNAWYNGTTFTLPFSENTVERAAQNRLELLPQQPQKN